MLGSVLSHCLAGGLTLQWGPASVSDQMCCLTSCYINADQSVLHAWTRIGSGAHSVNILCSDGKRQREHAVQHEPQVL